MAGAQWRAVAIDRASIERTWRTAHSLAGDRERDAPAERRHAGKPTTLNTTAEQRVYPVRGAGQNALGGLEDKSALFGSGPGTLSVQTGIDKEGKTKNSLLRY